MLALIKRNAVLNRIDFIAEVAEGGWFSLPNGHSVSPAYEGWSLNGYEIAKVLPADSVPDGVEVVSTEIKIVDGSPKVVQTYADKVHQYKDLTMRQFWLAAFNAGVTRESLEEAVRFKYEKEVADLIMLEVGVTTSFSRSYPLVDELCAVAGLSAEELDHLWKWAESI